MPPDPANRQHIGNGSLPPYQPEPSSWEVPERDSSSQKNPPQQPSAAQQQYTGEQAENTQLQTAPGQESQNQVFWMSRPHMPEAPDIPEEAKRRHDESKRLYPGLNLSRGEFIISAVRRHPIGLVSIWLTAGLVIVLAVTLFVFTSLNQGMFSNFFGGQGNAGITLMVLAGAVALLLSALAVVGGFIATYVYKQNRFFLTNESVIQCIQRGLFSRREQTVSLQNIEDASYFQEGIIQHIFNFGNIRLSTQGDETTYRFSYVKDPKHHIALLNNAVEAFKNGRPVMHLED